MTLLQHMQIMAKGAIRIIQDEVATFTKTDKVGYDGVADDLVTTADIKAQEFYRTYIEREFPEDGIIGEENLNAPSRNGRYFTLDPLDGTKAYGRRQSKGVATMIAHVNEMGKVDAMCIGDVNTGELFCYGEGIEPTRIRFDVPTLLPKTKKRPFTEMYALLREHPDQYPWAIQDMVSTGNGGIMKNIHVESGSIGLTLSQLWTGEVGMVVLLPGFETPWDSTPVIGMNMQLDIVSVKLVKNHPTDDLEVVTNSLPKKVAKRDYTEILIRRQHLPELMAWYYGNQEEKSVIK